jgi:hypothetical protein
LGGRSSYAVKILKPIDLKPPGGPRMNETLHGVKEFIDQCSEKERKALFEYLRRRLPRHPLEEQWDIDAETILTAIYRSPDLTQRGVRGILAEAVFERDILPSVEKLGWHVLPVSISDPPYDFILESEGQRVTIQVKLQRTEKANRSGTNPKVTPESFTSLRYRRLGQERRGRVNPQEHTPPVTSQLGHTDSATSPFLRSTCNPPRTRGLTSAIQ